MRYHLKDLIKEKITGEWGNESVNGEGNKVIRTTNFTNNGRIDFKKIVIRNIDSNKVNKKHLKKGDIIIEKSGGSPAQPVGRVVFFDLETDEKFLCNNFTTILRPNNDLVDSKYLLYQLQIGYHKGRTRRYQNKTTGIINLQLDKYLEEKIEVPSLPDQLHIANLLSKAETLITQRKETLRLLDEYLKSTFLEMFGDPIKREKRWNSEACGNLFDMKLGKMLSAKNYTGTHLKKYLRNVNVKWGEIDLSDLKEMDFSEKEVENYTLLKGDILVCEGGDVGRTAILKYDLKEYCFQNALHRLRIKDYEQINANYFSWFMFLGVTRGLIKSSTISVTIQHFTQERFKKLQIPLPPLELQTQFAQIVEKTEALKTKYQQSLRELENLYNTLSQKVFRGELGS
ncbi:MAG: restriction endonuclease subunit S [Bacteroidia bacterium]|nr:restriction endonuclease subunit S [Bacteroidia bacterium]